MENVLDFKKPSILKLEENELKVINGGFLGALALGLAAMALAYQLGKDVARFVKAQENK